MVTRDKDLLSYSCELALVLDRMPGNYIPDHEQAKDLAIAIIEDLDRRRSLMAEQRASRIPVGNTGSSLNLNCPDCNGYGLQNGLAGSLCMPCHRCKGHGTIL